MNRIGARSVACVACVVASVHGTASAQTDTSTSARIGLTDPATLLEASGSVVDRELKSSFYGFADFTYGKILVARDDAFRALIESPGTFYVGNLNVYFDTSFDDFRSLIEIRFLYQPNGATDELGGNYVEATAGDHADLFRRLTWGGIEIERAWVEYAVRPELVLRFGQWLTPYGIWNVDHGTPTIVAVRRPYTIGNALLPERQTGVQLRGATPVGSWDLSYAVTLSNGRGPIDTYLDLDENKAVGARAVLRGYSFGDLQLGGSAYYGRYTAANRNLAIRDDPIFVADRQIDEQYDELALAGDLRLKLDRLLVQLEFIANQRRYTRRGRPRVALAVNDALTPDQWVWGGYVLLGYESPLFGVMPYLIVERTQNWLNPLGIEGAAALYGGLNWRAHPRFTVKLQGTYIFLEGSSAFGRSRIPTIDAQVAWAF